MLADEILRTVSRRRALNQLPRAPQRKNGAARPEVLGGASASASSDDDDSSAEGPHDADRGGGKKNGNDGGRTAGTGMDCSQLEGEIAEIRDEIDSVLFPQVQQQGKSLEAAMGRNHELLEQLKQATAQKEKYLQSIERTRAALRRRWTVSASRGASTWNGRLHELLARVLLGARGESASSGAGNSDTLAATATPETDAEGRNLLWDVLNREEGLEFGKCVGQLVGAVEQGAIPKQRTEMSTSVSLSPSFPSGGMGATSATDGPGPGASSSYSASEARGPFVSASGAARSVINLDFMRQEWLKAKAAQQDHGALQGRQK